ncbi:MAG: SCP-2 sterol transfer family protein [Lachnospiraceae bacterium]|nr:SCP-2 sterol transfer family protein [Candidatus Colinaster scatohippi]
MVYEDVVIKVRSTFEEADARRIYEHVAFEIDIVGEAAGAMYFEVSNRACVIEPYNYYDNDGVFVASADVLIKLSNLEVKLKDALESGMLEFRGNEQKLKLCLDNIRLPGVKYD